MASYARLTCEDALLDVAPHEPDMMRKLAAAAALPPPAPLHESAVPQSPPPPGASLPSIPAACPRLPLALTRLTLHGLLRPPSMPHVTAGPSSPTLPILPGWAAPAVGMSPGGGSPSWGGGAATPPTPLPADVGLALLGFAPTEAPAAAMLVTALVDAVSADVPVAADNPAVSALARSVPAVGAAAGGELGRCGVTNANAGGGAGVGAASAATPPPRPRLSARRPARGPPTPCSPDDDTFDTPVSVGGGGRGSGGGGGGGRAAEGEDDDPAAMHFGPSKRGPGAAAASAAAQVATTPAAAAAAVAAAKADTEAVTADVVAARRAAARRLLRVVAAATAASPALWKAMYRGLGQGGTLSRVGKTLVKGIVDAATALVALRRAVSGTNEGGDDAEMGEPPAGASGVGDAWAARERLTVLQRLFDTLLATADAEAPSGSGDSSSSTGSSGAGAPKPLDVTTALMGRSPPSAAKTAEDDLYTAFLGVPSVAVARLVLEGVGSPQVRLRLSQRALFDRYVIPNRWLRRSPRGLTSPAVAAPEPEPAATAQGRGRGGGRGRGRGRGRSRGGRDAASRATPFSAIPTPPPPVFGPTATPLSTPTRGAAANGRGATATPAERGQVFCASKWIQVLLPRVPPDGGGTPAAVALHALLLVTAWSAFVEACVAAPPTRSGRRRAARRASAVGGSPGSAGCGGGAAASAGGPPPDDGSVEAGLLRASLNGGGGGSGEAVLLSEARLDMASRRELVAAMDEEFAARRAPGGLWAATPGMSAVLGQTRNAIAAALGVDA